jgi:TonB-dependent starch-binding outer membrane protein SusC
MRKLVFFYAIALLFISMNVNGQQRKIQGVVYDAENKQPLSNVSILGRSSKLGATSDVEGKFTLTVPDDAKELVVSSVGYETQIVPIGTAPSLQINLLRKSISGEEVVVVGYGSVRKKDLTGAVSSIRSAEFDKMPVTRADQFIQGRASGVHVTQTNQAPGGNVSIRIRGTNSINSGNEPLFVIDGFPGAEDLNSINPNDIESIEILKDASATAIYGSRGANGVILVNTKKGRAGKQVITAEMYYGFQKAAKTYDMMNATEFAGYLNKIVEENNALNGTNTALPYSPAQIAKLGTGTDWQDAVLRTAPIASYSIGLNGGNADTKYNLSLNYFDQRGIVINSYFKRGTIRYNFDKNIGSKFKFGMASSLAYTGENAALVNTNGGSQGGVIYDALRFNPALPVRDSSGAYTYINDPAPYVVPAGNPVAYAENATDKRNSLRTLVSAHVEYEIIPKLKYKILGGVDIRYNTRDFYTPSFLYLSTQNLNTGNARKSNSQYLSWVNEHTVTYDKTINENHVINLMGGASIQAFYRTSLVAAANGFFTNELSTNNIGLGATPLVPGSGKSKNSLASFFGRVNYRLFERFLFTATLRADGSSRFGSGNKWGYFPSAAFAWRLKDENFLASSDVVSDLKFRIGYGVTGNQEIGNYQSLPQYSSNYGYTLGGIRVVGVGLDNIPNPSLSWESTSSFDVGLDFAFFSSRIRGTIDYYRKRTDDLLFRSFIPTTSGFNSKLINAGSVGNNGFEFGLNYVAITNKRFTWDGSLNFSINRNKVLDLNGTDNLLAGASSSNIFVGSGTPTSILRVGQPIGSFYGYQFGGIWQTPAEILASGTKQAVKPGDPIYLDLNRDSVLTGADRIILGNALPKFIYGFTNNFHFGNFSLGLFIQGVSGVNVLNQNLYELENGFNNTNKMRTVLNSWNGPGTSNSMPRVSSLLRRGTGITSEVIEDGSYLRLKTLTLAYDWTKIKSKWLKTATVYTTVQNLYTFTNYSGYDPEVNSYNDDNADLSNNLSLNTDYNSYPASRTIIFGVRFSFQ